MMAEFHGFEVIETDNFEQYKNRPGVWAMLGIEKGDESKKYVCLNVGKCENIGKELEIDLYRLNHSELVENKDYRNQFSELKFSYPEHTTRLDFLYREIAQNYEDFLFILVVDRSDYNIEKYFAFSTKAAYWASGGVYKHEMDEERKRQTIKNEKNKAKPMIDPDLVKKIDEFKAWLDKQ